MQSFLSSCVPQNIIIERQKMHGLHHLNKERKQIEGFNQKQALEGYRPPCQLHTHTHTRTHTHAHTHTHTHTHTQREREREERVHTYCA